MTVRALLARPRWFILAVLMAVVVPGSVRLGLWQLDRLDERMALNTIWEHRLAADPVPVDVITSNAAALAREDLRHVRVEVEGTFVVDEQILVRNRPQGGRNGNWVVTPMVRHGGSTLAILRGWVPFEVVDPSDRRLTPPRGLVVVEGVLIPGEEPAGLGPRDESEGRLARMVLLDLERLGEQVGADLGGYYVQQTSPGDLPALVGLVDIDDDGPHLAYAIQWFSFALIGAAGFAVLVRRESKLLRKEPDV